MKVQKLRDMISCIFSSYACGHLIENDRHNQPNLNLFKGEIKLQSSKLHSYIKNIFSCCSNIMTRKEYFGWNTTFK
jgi:hypothetical protein